MGRFGDLKEMKNKIVEKLYMNDDIVKCLLYKQDVNFLNKTIPEDYDRTTLMYNQIYPYRFVPDLQSEANIFITIGFGFSSSRNANKYRNSSINFFIIVHQSLIQSDEGLKYDFLIDKIDALFYQSDEFKSCKLQFDKMNDFLVDSSGKWVGMSISYLALGF
jgi:hypothetical protein